MDKKRDRKGRILRDGERQRSDGRYEYRYSNLCGEIRSVYSWRLVETDRTPPGKRECEPLRSIEARIANQLADGIDVSKAHSTTMDEAFEMYVSLHPRWKPSTRYNKRNAYNAYIKPSFGKRRVADIRLSKIKRLYIELQEERGLSYNTVKLAHTVLHAIFESLVQDDVIRKNPADKALDGVEINRVEKKTALSLAEQNRLVEFMETSLRFLYWRPLITFLLGTGARIGEACALRWKNVDFSAGIIHIRENLIQYKEENVLIREYTTVKTSAGERDIPMLDEVKDALWGQYCRATIKKRRADISDELVFVTKFGAPLKQGYAAKIIHNIREDCNLSESLIAKEEGREPILLPEFTPHILRHTFCTRLCEQGVNVKVVQTVMGHSDIQTTMNVYTDADSAFIKTSFRELNGKIRMA